MTEPEASTSSTSDSGTAPAAVRSQDEVALELMKFIAVSTGYGKASQPSAGFSGKPVAGSAEEHAEALLELFERCRRVVKKES
ncbi:MAG: hypothetical protein ABSH44_07315 [Bryobacteraceae bacterium]|jgi:hypothetical protein